jgi:hypothetical protein
VPDDLHLAIVIDQPSNLLVVLVIQT